MGMRWLEYLLSSDQKRPIRFTTTALLHVTQHRQKKVTQFPIKSTLATSMFSRKKKKKMHATHILDFHIFCTIKGFFNFSKESGKVILDNH